MGEEKALAGKIRLATPEDKKRNIFTVSYSKLDLFDQCNRRYKLKYIDKNYGNSDSIALRIGTCAHKVIELKARNIMEDKPVDYDYLKTVFYEGVTEATEKGTEEIMGVNEIKKKFFDDFFAPDNASGMNYVQKCDLFMDTVVKEELTNEDWIPIAAELPFDFVYLYTLPNGEEREVLIHGFIDSVRGKDFVDGKPTRLKVVDYKTSKKRYDDKKMATPLQQIIYGMALYTMYGILPEEYEYSFIFINERQKACTKGYMNRAIKKLDKIFNKIYELEMSNEYPPSPSPLCHWCDFCATNDNADVRMKDLCPYYSLWKPNEKTFAVNKTYDANEDKEIAEGKKPAKRKLIF